LIADRPFDTIARHLIADRVADDRSLDTWSLLLAWALIARHLGGGYSTLDR
jgi:hypothetical protein